MSENRKPTLDLSGLLTIRTISNAKDAIIKSIDESEALDLVISDESDVDITGIQLIIAAQLYAQGASKRLSLAAPISGRALNLMDRAGLFAEMSVENRQFWLHEGV
ncbi:MAG: hypothetical protein JSR78_18205 [Proteobacteria bacterium]|nr:hypothetical protein [Pseudomonadota bacterium]